MPLFCYTHTHTHSKTELSANMQSILRLHTFSLVLRACLSPLLILLSVCVFSHLCAISFLFSCWILLAVDSMCANAQKPKSLRLGWLQHNEQQSQTIDHFKRAISYQKSHHANQINGVRETIEWFRVIPLSLTNMLVIVISIWFIFI